MLTQMIETNKLAIMLSEMWVTTIKWCYIKIVVRNFEVLTNAIAQY
jgi:hypothetical protein